ncbi:MAG: hypothetical protein NC548_13100 [Lachnospiraceae bacterium]|nr:hypothetical protein [Lachnospiraceae bacterium]MCM1230673.1 hypothetical protein [Ruminococcus flavefaciens]
MKKIKSITIPMSKIMGVFEIASSVAASIFIDSLYTKEQKAKDTKMMCIIKQTGVSAISSAVAYPIITGAFGTMMKTDLDIKIPIGKKGEEAPNKEPLEKTKEDLQKEKEEDEEFFNKACQHMEHIVDKFPDLWETLLNSIRIIPDPDDSHASILETLDVMFNEKDLETLRNDPDVYDVMTFIACVVCGKDDEEDVLKDLTDELRIIARGYFTSKRYADNKEKEDKKYQDKYEGDYFIDTACDNMINIATKHPKKWSKFLDSIALVPKIQREEDKPSLTYDEIFDNDECKEDVKEVMNLIGAYVIGKDDEAESLIDIKDKLRLFVVGYVNGKGKRDYEISNRFFSAYEDYYHQVIESIPGLLNEFGDLYEFVSNIEYKPNTGVVLCSDALIKVQKYPKLKTFVDDISFTIILKHLINGGDILDEFSDLERDIYSKIDAHYKDKENKGDGNENE